MPALAAITLVAGLFKPGGDRRLDRAAPPRGEPGASWTEVRPLTRFSFSAASLAGPALAAGVAPDRRPGGGG